MAKKGNDYLGLSYPISLILAIIPVTAWILGVVTRIMEGKLIQGIIRNLPFIGLPIWILDLIFMITKKEIFRLG